MKTIRILTIGNSFSENALTYLEDLAQSGGSVRFHIGRANLGGCSLEKHWNLAVYTKRCPEHRTYRIAGSGDKTTEGSLQVALRAAPWDCVTLQQVSRKSWRAQTWRPCLGKLVNMVRKLVPQANIFLHQTWAYRSDSPFFPENGLTQERMFARIQAACAGYAGELGCGVLPCGEAVQLARRTPGRVFSWPDPDFDYLDPDAAPALPDQEHSLAVGWRWAINNSPEGIPQLRLDANHLNARGCYLAGCVWFERLTGIDVRDIVFRPEDIDGETAAFLRAKAHEACGCGSECHFE